MHQSYDQNAVQAILDGSSTHLFKVFDDSICLVNDEHTFVATVSPSDIDGVHKLYIAFTELSDEAASDCVKDVLTWLNDFADIKQMIACVELDNTSSYYAISKAGFYLVGVISTPKYDVAIFQYRFEVDL
jgi:RimJ/RimL family protein N-acetyltransferase